MFENARKGLGKIYKAEILTILAAIIAIVAAIVMFAMGKVVRTEASSINTADIVSLISMLVALVIGIISFFLNLFGIIAASKDDESFKNALITLFIGIISSVVASILRNKHADIATYFDAINNISELFVMYYVIAGCVNIAVSKKNEALAATGNKTKVIIIVIWAIGLVLNFFKGYFEGKGTTTALGVAYIIIAVVGAIASIVSYIIYLVILRKTIDSL